MPPLYYKKSKDVEFYEACERIRRECKGELSTKQIAIRAEAQECSSFFLTVDRIRRLLWNMLTDRHVPPNQRHIRDKHREIYRRYKVLLSEDGDQTLTYYAEKISTQSAPRFYLSENYAPVFYYKLIRNRSRLGKCKR